MIKYWIGIVKSTGSYEEKILILGFYGITRLIDTFNMLDLMA